MIFAYFSPLMASLHVADAALRANLSWMLLLGFSRAAAESKPLKI